MKKLTKGITVINQLLFILKQVDKKRRRKLYFFGFISVFNAFIEILFLNTFAAFISYLISIQSENIDSFNLYLKSHWIKAHFFDIMISNYFQD